MNKYICNSCIAVNLTYIDLIFINVNTLYIAGELSFLRSLQNCVGCLAVRGVPPCRDFMPRLAVRGVPPWCILRHISDHIDIEWIGVPGRAFGSGRRWIRYLVPLVKHLCGDYRTIVAVHRAWTRRPTGIRFGFL